MLEKIFQVVAKMCLWYLDRCHAERAKDFMPKKFNMDMNADLMTATMTLDDCPGLQAMAIEAAKMMTSMPAANNYIEMKLASKCQMVNPVIMTIQWADRKSPADLVSELKDTLEEVEQLKDKAMRAGTQRAQLSVLADMGEVIKQQKERY